MSSPPDPLCTDPPRSIRARRSCGRFWPLGVLAAAMLAAWLLDLDRYLTFAALREHRAQIQDLAAAHGVAAMLAVVAIYVGVVGLSIPGATILTVAAGFLFGTLGGALVALVGATAGATLVFLLARGTLGPMLAVRAQPFLGRMECGFRSDAFSYLLALRLMPVCPFWIVNLVPALVGIPVRTYVLATVVGILPATFLFAALGAGLDGMLDSPEGLDAAAMLKPKILLALGALAALALLPVAFRRLRRH